MAMRVAVIGAGPCGLMALKNLKEEGFDVTVFEARDWIGGIWQYSTDSALSVAESTIFNSSRFRSSISDYPFDDDVDDFPTWQQMHRYLKGYCDQFDLHRHIQLGTRVTNLSRDKGRWVVDVASKDGPVRHEKFDKVIVAIGTFVKPKTPKILGIEKFEGPALHAVEFNTPSKYDGQNVLLVGLHATAQDVAKTLEGHAKKLYLAHKNGLILLPRHFANGATFDQGQSVAFLFFHVFMETWFPNLFVWLLNKLMRAWSKKAFPDVPKSWKFDNAPSVGTTPPLVGAEVYELMKSGFAEPVDPIQEVIGPKSARLRDGSILNDIDAIIFCTGYDTTVPFLAKEYNPYSEPGKPGDLYRNIFPIHPDPSVRSSLAYIGHAGIPLPGFVQHELCAMAIAQVWRGRTPFVSYEAMKAWHAKNLEWRKAMKATQKVESTFYVAYMPFGEHIRYLNWAAGTGVFENFGLFSLRAWAFWWRDRELYRKVKGGLMSPAIWRLFDMGKRKPWDRARAQILKDNEFAERRMKIKAEEFKKRMEAEDAKKKV